jgi:hypothetical protein
MIRLLLIFWLIPHALLAQINGQNNVSGWDTLDQVLIWRSELQSAVKTQNQRELQRLTDLLRDANSGSVAALPWDERWPLYLLTGRYSILLDEVRRHTPVVRATEMAAALPPKDSVFNLLDQWLYQNWTEGVYDPSVAVLSEADRQFVEIITAYLLRESPPEEVVRRGAFIRQFPQSPYRAFMESNMRLPVPPRRRFFGLDLLFVHQQYQNQLERHFNPAFGLGLDFLYHRKHFFAGLGLKFTGNSVARDLNTNGLYHWDKGDSYALYSSSVYAGYRVLSVENMAFSPFAEIGTANLYYNIAEDEEDDFELNKSEALDYNAYFWGVGLVTDLKLRKHHQSDGQENPWAYSGVRLKMGWRPLRFGQFQPAYKGGALYVAIGVQLML